jgi:hypothetical protein
MIKDVSCDFKYSLTCFQLFIPSSLKLDFKFEDLNNLQQKEKTLSVVTEYTNQYLIETSLFVSTDYNDLLKNVCSHCCEENDNLDRVLSEDLSQLSFPVFYLKLHVAIMQDLNN